MKKIIVIILFMCLSLIISACTADEAEEKIVFDRNVSDYDWFDDCKMFNGFQFEVGKEIFIVYKDNNPFLICYDNKANLLWKREVYNIRVLDTYQTGLLIEKPLAMMNLEGENDWIIEGEESTKLLDNDDGAIYMIKNSFHGEETILRLDKDGNKVWENDTYSIINNIEIESNKIIIEYSNVRVLALLDFEGNELFTINVSSTDYRRFVTDDSFYYYNVRTETLYKYDFSKNIIYTFNDVNFDNFLFEYEEDIFISSQEKIIKIDQNGKKLFEITDPSNYLCDYQFHTSFEDGSFIVSTRIIDNKYAFYKYNKNGELILQKNIDNELSYVERFSSGNLLFEYTDLFSQKDFFVILDSNLNLIYESEEYSNLDLKKSITNHFMYNFLDNKKGCVVFNEDGSFYLTKTDSNKDMLFYVDKEGNENHKFDIYTYGEEYGFVSNILLLENKILFNIKEGNKTKYLLTDYEGNIELSGDYLGIINYNNGRKYYIKDNDEIKEITVTFSN